MKTLAFLIGLCIGVVGIVGILLPSSLVWIARHFSTSGAFYAVAMIRVVFGLILVFVASASRAPKALRILGSFIALLGVLTALTGLVAMEQARSTIDWWLRQGPGLVRLTSMALIALGGFVVYACAPTRTDLVIQSRR